MIVELVIAAAVIAVGGGTAAIYRAASRNAKRDRQLAAPPKERGIRELLPGDVVGLEGKDYLVEGIITYDEDGHVWTAARLMDDGKEKWIMVGMDRAPGAAGPVRFLERDTTLQLTAYPPDVLEFGGEQYRMTSRGNATVTPKGEVGVSGLGKSLLRIRYWRFTAPGDRMVLIEQWGSDYRACSGRIIPEHMIMVLPAS